LEYYLSISFKTFINARLANFLRSTITFSVSRKKRRNSIDTPGVTLFSLEGTTHLTWVLYLSLLILIAFFKKICSSLTLLLRQIYFIPSPISNTILRWLFVKDGDSDLLIRMYRKKYSQVDQFKNRIWSNPIRSSRIPVGSYKTSLEIYETEWQNHIQVLSVGDLLDSCYRNLAEFYRLDPTFVNTSFEVRETFSYPKNHLLTDHFEKYFFLTCSEMMLKLHWYIEINFIITIKNQDAQYWKNQVKSFD
jgi:hypothetical protein